MSEREIIPEERFRIYCRAHEGELTLVATCATPEALGVAIVTLGREQEFEDCALGVLDTMGEKHEKWIVRPWERSAQNVSVAASVLARSKAKPSSDRDINESGGYDISDPKHPDFHSIHADLWDSREGK